MFPLRRAVVDRLRARMTHVMPSHPRPDMFPLRRAVVDRLRARDAEGAAAALDAFIKRLREGEGLVVEH